MILDHSGQLLTIDNIRSENRLLQYALTGTGYHFIDTYVFDMGYDWQAGHHPQVAHVDTLTMECQLQTIAVNRHDDQTVK